MVKRKNIIFGLVLLFSSTGAAGVALAAESADTLKTDEEKFSYYLGLEFGAVLKGADFKADRGIINRAIDDVLSDKPLLLSKEMAMQVRHDLAKKVQETQKAKLAALAEKNAQEGAAFLKKNRDEKGVVATSSGLQYKMITAGKGRRPSEKDQVTVHYRGTLIDGTEFDSSYKRSEPTTFPLSGVISGWTEGVQLMNVGSKYKFFIPPNLAYGSSGAGKLIGPESTLIFEVELLEIK
ncbi:MAG: FKBP-type peptidyl-prolyl cis-trans isomerase [Magnetococcales bacterium]|nr:FKBP-type peptidyl-prolyl cis-trans isomerase [Magnetococcales bacterium]